NGELSVCDIGGGGGFGSIGLKIVYGELKVRIVDCVNKRIEFVNDLGGEVGVEDVSFVDDGGEIYGKGV
ncbi:RsmG family class I SAM-dependent methyltransferase, partial [Staphylococcus epidermidis]|uniref:RsmG family class I SAM-dependent methyltransferase n=1 Tax=Staphylococcus epidermidis TaxID=1282 RepID=UPI00164338FA